MATTISIITKDKTTSLSRQLLAQDTAAKARQLIGAGTSSLGLGSTSSTAKAGDWRPTLADVTDAGTAGRAVAAAETPAAALAYLLPAGGADGQVLGRAGGGVAWVAASSGSAQPAPTSYAVGGGPIL